MEDCTVINIGNASWSRTEFDNLRASLDEKAFRLQLGTMALELGWGGITKLQKVSGASRKRIRRGMHEVLKMRDGQYQKTTRIRAPGGGRKLTEVLDPELPVMVHTIVKRQTYGNPQEKILHTSLSLDKIQEKLKSKFNRTVSQYTILRILQSLGYTKQQNKKAKQVGKPHVDRDKQFRNIKRIRKWAEKKGIPLLSIDCKKKEMFGSFKNNGRIYLPKSSPLEVLDHDFVLKDLGWAIPYGIYDIVHNVGFINLGFDHDTSDFAVASLRYWLRDVAPQFYQDIKQICILCDGGGSNSSRTYLWKYALAELSQETGIEFVVAHYPPGTSKYNYIEHRLFSEISKNWAGIPLTDAMAMYDLIISTSTKTDLKVFCHIDINEYPTKKKVSDEQRARIKMTIPKRMPQWNYHISGLRRKPKAV